MTSEEKYIKFKFLEKRKLETIFSNYFKVGSRMKELTQFFLRKYSK